MLQLELEQLPSVPDSFPVLPLGHLTAVRCLKDILQDTVLTPKKCHILEEELVFFSYGSIHYRPSSIDRGNIAEAPVGLVFKHSVLDSINCFFPYDTGLVSVADRHLQDFPSDWISELSRFDRYRVNSDNEGMLLRKLIFHIYGSHKNYLRGTIQLSSSLNEIQLNCDAISTIVRFLAADLCSTGIDHRQATIECQSSNPVSLIDNLVWIGLPDSHYEIYQQICKLRPRMPPDIFRSYFYESGRNFHPKDIAHELMVQAKKDIIQMYLDFEMGLT